MCNDCANASLVERGGNTFAVWQNSYNLGTVVSPDDLEDDAESMVETTKEKGFSYSQMSTRGQGSLAWILGD